MSEHELGRYTITNNLNTPIREKTAGTLPKVGVMSNTKVETQTMSVTHLIKL